MTSLDSYSQQALVQRAISWSLVQRRLDAYEALAKAFPIELLKRGAYKEPYFCHYMAWRLGTWEDETQISRLNELLESGQSIRGWEGERSLLESFEFADFWSLVWQLQVAEYLVEVGRDVRWCSGTNKNGGPDLVVTLDDAELFVECFVYRKSFALEEYINELVGRFGKWRAEHSPCLKYFLPKDYRRTRFLSELFAPLLDEANTQRLAVEAQRAYPIGLPIPVGTKNFRFYVEGDDVDSYDPLALADVAACGDPERYIEVVLNEIANCKRGKNRLADHRPNIVVANLSLSGDAQMALHRQRELNAPLPAVDLPRDIDALACSAIGIDVRLSRSDLLLIKANDQSSGAAAIAMPRQS